MYCYHMRKRKKKTEEIIGLESSICRSIIKDLRRNGFQARVGNFYNQQLGHLVDPHIKIIAEGYPDLNIRIDIVTNELKIAANGKNIYKIGLEEPTSISGISTTIRALHDRFTNTNNSQSTN